jgi:hypothetical protein
VCAISGTKAVRQFTGARVTFLGQVNWWLCARGRGFDIIRSLLSSNINFDINFEIKETK